MFYFKFVLGNPDYLDVNFDFLKTMRILDSFLSLETLASETRKISIRNHTSFFNRTYQS